MEPEKNLNRRDDILICLFLAIAILAIYWRAIGYDFSDLDDNIYVTENYHVKTGLSLDNITWAFTTVYAEFWHPVTWLSHMFVSHIAGLDPGMHHLANILLHLLNSIILFLVMKRMTLKTGSSLVVAFLFAAHPVNVEPVIWISSRKDVLSTFFFILSIWAYVSYSEKKTIYSYFLVLFLFSMGLMSKPMVISLPFVLFLFDYWPLKRWGNGIDHRDDSTPATMSLIKEKIPLLVISLLFSFLTLKAQQRLNSFPDFKNLFFQFEEAVITYGAYLSKLVWPHELAIYYPHPLAISPLKFFGAFFLLTFLSLLFFRILKRPYAVVGWSWYLITLLPVSGIVRTGCYMADHYAYIPFTGLFIIIAWGGAEIIDRFDLKKKSTGILVSITGLTLMTLSFIQTGYWKDSVTLFEHALKITADNFLIQNNLGISLLKRNNLSQAIEHFSEAMRLDPFHPGPCTNMGVIMERQNRTEDAIHYYSMALRMDPDFPEALLALGNILVKTGKASEAIRFLDKAIKINTMIPSAYLNMGIAMETLGRRSQAIYYFRKAIEREPSYIDAKFNLAAALTCEKKFHEAARQYSEIIRTNPDLVDAILNLGIILENIGDHKGAIAHYSEALRQKPDFVEAHFNLAIALAKDRNFADAIYHYSEALRIKPDFAEAHNSLGIILVKQGKLEDAIGHFRKALEINPAYSNARRNLDIALQGK